ncbi:MAG: hypothetical protein ACOVQT_13150 [Rubrivivax sp.]|jgi:hypothetical protein
MNTLNTVQRVTCFALAALMSVAIAESITGYALEADTHQVVAKAGRATAPVAVAAVPASQPVHQVAQVGTSF